MFKNRLLLIMLGFSLMAGGFLALQAQNFTPQVRTDPTAIPAQTPSPTQTPTESPARTRTSIQSTPTDLTGTYTGNFKCDVLGLNGETTLTINGNQLTIGDRTGQIVANTTRGYTAVALQLRGTDPNAKPQVVSFRGHKKGDRLTLTPVGAEKCTFTSSKGGRRQGTPAAMPSQTPSPSPSPTTSPEPNPSPTPSGSPSPMPSPSPGEPTPSPTPGEPTPSPSASPTPSPSPSPSPRPQ